MALTLTQARLALYRTVLHAGAESYDAERLDFCLKEWLGVFLRLTKCTTTVTDVSLSQNDTTFDPTDDIYAGFEEDDMLDNCTINGFRVAIQPLGTVQRRYEGGNPTAARPRMLAFRSDDEVLLDAPCDQAYTLKVTHTAQLTAWTEGCQGAWASTTRYNVGDHVTNDGNSYRCILKHTNQEPPNTTYWEAVSATVQDPDDVDINVPEDWARLVIGTGCKHRLLQGVGYAHPDVPSIKEFWDVVAQAQRHFGRSETGADA